MATLGALGDDAETIEWARTTVSAHLEGGDVDDPELLTAALGVVAAHGDADTHTAFMKRYQESMDPQEQQRFLRALTAFDDAELGREVIDATLDGRIRNQDGSWVCGSLFGNRRAGGDLWREVRTRWQECVDVFPPMTFRRLIEGISALSRPDVAADVKAFFAETPVPTADKAVAQNLELLDANLAARERETGRVGEWLVARA